MLTEKRSKESKSRDNGSGSKLFYNGADERKNGIWIMVREELVERVLEVKRASDRLMTMKIVRVCSTGGQQHGGEK